MSNSFQDLRVWNLAFDLAGNAYDLCKKLPDSERYGIRSQLQRTALSIPCNIAEGHGRRSNGDFARFLAIALGSCREVQALLTMCERLNYLTNEECPHNECEDIAKMLTAFIKKFKSSSSNS